MSWRSTDEWPDDKYVLPPQVIEESLKDAARPDSPRPQSQGRRMRRLGMSAAAVIQVALLVAMVLVPAGSFAAKPSSDPSASSAQTQTDAKGKSGDAKAKKGTTETQTAPTANAKPGKGADKTPKNDAAPTTKGKSGDKGKPGSDSDRTGKSRNHHGQITRMT